MYKDKYSEEKDGLNARDRKNLTTKNRDLLIIISMSLKNKNNRLVKNLIKKNYLKTNKR